MKNRLVKALNFKFAGILVFILLLIIFIFFWVNEHSNTKELEFKIAEIKLVEEGSEISNKISYLKEVILKINKNNLKDKQFIDALIDINNNENKELVHTTLFKIYQLDYIKEIYLFNYKNQLITAFPSDSISPSKEILTRTLAINSAHEPIFVSSNYGNADNNFDMKIFLSIVDYKDYKNLIAKMVIVLNVNSYIKNFLSKQSKSFNSAEGLLLLMEGNELFYLLKLGNDNYNTNNTNFVSDFREKIKNAIKYKDQSILYYKDYLGKETINYISKINGYNWLLVYKIDKSEIDGKVTQSYYRMIFLIVFLLILIVIILVMIKKYIINILKKEKSDYQLIANRLRQGELIAKVGNWEIDLNTKEVYSSLGAREIYGTDKESLSLTEIKSFPLPQYREALDKELEGLIKFNKPYEIEFKIRNRKTGEIIDIYSEAKYNRDENKIYGVIKDITEQNKIKRELQIAEERLRYAIEASKHGVWDYDLETGILFWDENSYKIFGYSNNEFDITFEKWKNMVHPEHLPKIMLIIEKLTKGIVTEFVNEFRIKNKNGDYIWIEAKGKVVSINASGKPTRITGLYIDINDRKKAEMELKKIEWMLTKKFVLSEISRESGNIIYKTDSKGLIFNNLGLDVLKEIIFDYLNLLETSSIIFESDGSYALGIFISEWCINLHESKKLRKNEFTEKNCTNCYYDEWEMCGKQALIKKEKFEYECKSGIKILGVPIFVYGQAIGAICTSISEPPSLDEIIDDVANTYDIPSIALKRYANNYNKRPEYIIGLAKERINKAAKMISTLVEKNITQNELFSNRELYRSLVESSDAIILLIDTNGNILYINKIGAEYFNTDPDKLITRNYSDLFEISNFQIQKDILSLVISNNEKRTDITTLIFNGKMHQFRTNYYPVKNTTGKVYAVLINAYDITDLITAEAEKEKTQEMFNSFMDYFTGGVFVKDRKGIVIYVNKYLREIFSAEEWIGKNAIESFPGEIGEKLFIDDMETFEKGYKKIVESIPCIDGKKRIYETHKFVIERENDEPLLGGLTIDITSLIEAQKSLVEAKEQQEKILNAIPDMIFELDSNFNIKWVNTFSKKYLNKDVIGQNINYLVKGIAEQIKLDNKKGRVYYTESTLDFDEGTKFLGWWIKAEHNENNEIDYAIAAARDITEIKVYENKIIKLNSELEQRVKQRTAELEAANKELEAFTYSVSHDLRSPLRAIDGFSRIIMEDYLQVLDDEGKRLFNVIRYNTKKMDQLITDLLQLSRISRHQLELEEIELSEFIKEIYEEIIDESTRAKFVFNCKDLIKIKADKKLLKQVWVNLISNAVKYTLPKGNRVIEIKNYEEDEFIVTLIKDTGVGFNQEYKDKLFGVFQRLHRSEDFEGTGVGLAVVKRIVDKHGGKVWAEGKINEGATFFIAFPKI